MNKSLKIVLPSLFVLTIVALPFVVNAADESAIIPDCGRMISGEFVECGFGDLIQLINNIIRYLILIAVPVSAAVFAWAGFNMMIHPANPGERTASWLMMKKVFIGLVLILSAWLITNTLKNALVKDSIPLLIGN